MPVYGQMPSREFTRALRGPELTPVSVCGTRHPTTARLELREARGSRRNPFSGSALAPGGSWYGACLVSGSWTSPAHPSPRPVGT
jgi:hypothetical protein